jgi:tripartite-type tricarboxylate transporter receptor subunit TctC
MMPTKKVSAKILICVLLLLFGLATAGFTQQYPARPITIICQWPAGSNVDLVLRMLADPLQEELGQPVVVENVPGGGGVVGQNAMAKAKPDGYTIGLAALGPMVTAHLFEPKPPYKMTDFVAICGFYDNPGGLGVRKDAPWDNLDDFVADARRNPMGYKIGLHVARGPVGLSLKKFILTTGIKVRIVPFQGGKRSTQAVLSGDIDACAMHVGSVVRNPENVKMLTLFENNRSERLPDVLTAKESGYDLVMGARAGFVAPRGTPADRISTLESALKKVITEPRFTEEIFDKLGMVQTFIGHEEMWAQWEDTYRRYERIVQELEEAEKTFQELEEKK